MLAALGLLALCAQAAGAADAPTVGNVHVEALPVAPLSDLAKAVRALQLVQDRLATGNEVALDAQRTLLEQMAAKGADAVTPDTGMLALALFNGGDPARFGFARRAAELEPLLAGAFAFAEGRQARAAALLARVDAATLAPSVRAQFWLVTGSLLAGRDPAAAKAALAQARLEAPGTLIEEAALRREIHLLSGEPQRMMSLASSYLRRFGQSPFASAFVTQLAFSIAAAPPEVQSAMSTMLDGVLAQARAEDRQGFYAILARQTLVSGNHDLARTASERAASLNAQGPMHLSARLYRAALAIAAPEPADAAQELHSLMRAPLQPSDLEILRAAISVARELRRWPYDPPPAQEVPLPQTARGPGAGQAEAEEETDAMKAASRLIETTATLAVLP
jgi:chemotaxis protein MotC